MSRDATKFGLPRGRLTWNPDFQATLSDKNLWTGSVTFTCNIADVIALKPELKSPCQEPGFEFMGLVGLEVKNNEGDTATVNCRYSGTVSPDFGIDDPEEETPKTSSMAIGVSLEPITSHKQFKDLTQAEWTIVSLFQKGLYVAGKITNGVVETLLPNTYDSKLGIVTLEGDKLKKLIGYLNKGVDRYLAAHQVYRVNYTSNNRPTAAELNKVGYVTNAPGAPVVNDRDWLYMGVNYSESGDVYDITQEWELSGPGKNDPYLYKEPEE
jgi:hypothetical protein